MEFFKVEEQQRRKWDTKIFNLFNIFGIDKGETRFFSFPSAVNLFKLKINLGRKRRIRSTFLGEAAAGRKP